MASEPPEDLALPPHGYLAALLADHNPFNTKLTRLYCEPKRAQKFPTNITINRETVVSAVACHPLGLPVEYPETSSDKTFVAHVFSVDASINRDTLKKHIMGNILYSRGSHGAGHDLYVPMGDILGDANWGVVQCTESHYKCNGSLIAVVRWLIFILSQGNGHKICSQYDPEIIIPEHTYASRELLREQLNQDATSVFADISVERKTLFQNTFAQYQALTREGCGFPLREPTIFDEREQIEREIAREERKLLRRGQPEMPKCEGRLRLLFNSRSLPFIR